MNTLPYDSRILSFGSLEERMNREGKGGWYLEKEFFFAEENGKMEKDVHFKQISLFLVTLLHSNSVS